MIPTIIKPPYNMALDTCPFCNGVAQLQADTDDTYFVSCSNLQCFVLQLILLFSTKSDVISAWKRRSTPVVADPALHLQIGPMLIKRSETLTKK